nr:Chain C, SELS C-END DEGRON [Homo sapiens]6DO4_D Chain D, SELS C-END DEGRON [Homo sapiens]
GPSSGG